jgi:hypothetical protein
MTLSGYKIKSEGERVCVCVFVCVCVCERVCLQSMYVVRMTTSNGPPWASANFFWIIIILRATRLEIFPRARFAKDVSLLTIWPKDTHRQGLGVN